MDWNNRKAKQGITRLPRHLHTRSTALGTIHNKGNNQLGCKHDAHEVANCSKETPIYEENEFKGE